MKKVFVIFVLVLIISSCDEINKIINPSSDDYLIDKTVSASTTEQIIESGSEFQMIFPANSLKGNLEIKVKKESSYPTFSFSNTQLGKNVYKVKFSGESSFQSPAKIIINYDVSKVPGGKTASETIKAYICSNGIWKLSNYTLNESQKQLIISISNLDNPKIDKDNPKLQDNEGDIMIGDGYTTTDTGQDDNLLHVTIGTQVWMKKNLDVDHYQNGDAIPQVTDPIKWASLTTGAWCYYNNDPANGAIYGKLYNWYAVKDSRGLAPSGYHIPSNAEWTTLSTYLGGSDAAGGKMKEAGTVHWIIPNGTTGGTNSSGFTGLPGGYRVDNGDFSYVRKRGVWWSSTKDGKTLDWSNTLYSYNEYLSLNDNLNVDGFSVRCIRD